MNLEMILRNRAVLAALLGGLLIPASSFSVELYTPGKTEEQIKTEAVVRCHYQMGEFGSDAVNMCVQAEDEARKALEAYPDRYFEIVRRCNRAMSKAGWAQIKLCADRDIAAEKALQAYPPEHAELIAACREKVGRYGHDEIRQCVDKQIASKAGRD